MKQHRAGVLHPAWAAVLLLLPVIVGLAALCIGRISYPLGEIWDVIAAKLTGAEADKQMSIVIWGIRLPRVLLAMLVGAGLSVAGCAFQSLFANPLATPDTLGVASGTSFGAALALLLGMNLLGVQGVAFAFGILAVTLTWLTSAGKGKGLSSVVLGGIMIGSLFSSLVSLVKFTADTETQLPAITYWLMGSLAGAGFEPLRWGAPFIIAGILVLFLLRWQLNILPLGEDEARSLGSNIRALRAVTILCATAVTASGVAMCGQVGWVGLLIPHICRMAFGNDHRTLLPACISLGAVFLVIVDTLARTISAAEIPISVLTAIIGAPFFIVLMRKSGGWRL
ncbi:MAG: iron ABC transporter permease [Oscillospiraceae bacterium]|nr:iron ABC transporter permease [Oscillospiraceae bacterium]